MHHIYQYHYCPIVQVSMDSHVRGNRLLCYLPYSGQWQIFMFCFIWKWYKLDKVRIRKLSYVCFFPIQDWWCLSSRLFIFWHFLPPPMSHIPYYHRIGAPSRLVEGEFPLLPAQVWPKNDAADYHDPNSIFINWVHAIPPRHSATFICDNLVLMTVGDPFPIDLDWPYWPMAP